MSGTEMDRVAPGALTVLAEGGRLPAVYEAARGALERATQIDECQDWADKAAALASYAKQADDDTLHRFAERIKTRATRRVGELLKQIEPSIGGRPTHDGGGMGRTKAAAEAGLSERQKVTALRVASVPAEEFERQVESDKPPTVTALARQGTKPAAGERKPQAPGDESLEAFSRVRELCVAVAALDAPPLGDARRSSLLLELKELRAAIAPLLELLGRVPITPPPTAKANGHCPKCDGDGCPWCQPARRKP